MRRADHFLDIPSFVVYKRQADCQSFPQGVAMRRVLSITGLLWFVTSAVAAEKPLPKPLVTGLQNPVFIAVGLDGRIYITEMGEKDKDGDGRVVVLDNGKATP